MLKNYIKTLLLSTIVLVMGNNSNYCYSMEIEDEIDTSSSQNNNIINYINNQQIVNINKDDNEDYKHLFEVNYNKDYYDKICNDCINNVSENKPEYKIFMKRFSQLFDDIIDDLYRVNDDPDEFDDDDPDECNDSFDDNPINFLKKQKIIPFDNLNNFSKVFDNVSFTKSIKNDKLLDNNNSFLLSQLTEYNINTKKYIISNQQLTQREKDVRIDKLVGYGELSPIDVLIYIQNSVRKLKAQVMKALEDSILYSYNNIDIKNEGIIKEAQKILERVHELYYKEVFNWFLPNHVINKFGKLKKEYKQRFRGQEWQLQYEYIKEACRDLESNIARLDIFHYNGSNLNVMFDNLHKKIMATLDKVINDINNNRLQNVEVVIPNVYMYYSKLIDNTDSSYINTLFNNFKMQNNIGLRFIILKEFLKQLKEKLPTVKKLTDRRIKQQIDKYHVLLDNYFEKDDFTNEDEYKKTESIQNYIKITNSIMRHFSDHIRHVDSKKLIQCRDFLEAFRSYYEYYYFPDSYEWTYVLKYNPGQSPQETLQQVLLNNNDSFDLGENNVENLTLVRDNANYTREFSNSSDED